VNLSELLHKHKIAGAPHLIEIELRRLALERRMGQAPAAMRLNIQRQLGALPKANKFARMDAEYLLECERKIPANY
jgi:hypothetical protein